MNHKLNPKIAHSSEIKTEINATDLLHILDRFHKQIKVLSLDCFDTILWRQTATPADVFFELQHRPAFQALSYSAVLRMNTESIARRLQYVKNGSTEVSLKDIYLTGFPNLDTEAVQSLMEEELAAEMEACYAFSPFIDLIRTAQSRGIKVIIASDIYFKESQLRRLLASKLPQDAMAAIDKIFCSCDHGKSKSVGLFPIILEQMQVSPSEILHIGDNPIADFDAANKLGLHALHFVPFDKSLSELFRMQTMSGCFINPSLRTARAFVSPFRGVIAAAQPQPSIKPESLLGYVSLGPIMYSFAQFICKQTEKLSLEGKNPKIIFLMRDAYLPSLACEAIAGKAVGTRIRISRFASYAASFKTEEDINRYLADTIKSKRYEDICHQLLLPENIAKPLIQKAENAINSLEEFNRLIHQTDILKIIFEQSKKYRDRLKHHLEKEIDLQRGDTLLFVDLGYVGTAQIKLEPVFRDEWEVNIIGCYFLALATPSWKSSRCGLLDPSWCDERTLSMLVSYVALLEQLCTSNENSVIDFDQEGNPIFTETSVSRKQHIQLGPIQDECLRFIRDAEQLFQQNGKKPSINILRDVALAELGRLIFFPTAQELKYLKNFQFDLNMGTNDLIKVFDQNEGLNGLRRRGLFFMEKNLKSMRTNYPAELRHAGLELTFLLMSMHRFGLEFVTNDFSLRRETIEIILIRGNELSRASLEALPTHDGYFSLFIPIGNGNFQVGMMMGLHYRWFQVESMQIIKTSSLLSDVESENTVDANSNIIFDQIVDKGDGLMECLSEASLLILTPLQKSESDHYVFRLVFRPLVKSLSTVSKEERPALSTSA